MTEKLSFAEKFGYGLGDMAANFIFQAMLALQLDFYTHTFGLTAAQAGTLFLVVGLGVACLNPVMGVIADRTSTKWGKFRPWLLWTAVLRCRSGLKVVLTVVQRVLLIQVVRYLPYRNVDYAHSRSSSRSTSRRCKCCASHRKIV